MRERAGRKQNVAIRTGKDNMTRKASGTERSKLVKKHMDAIEDADAQSTRYEDVADALNEALIQVAGGDDVGDFESLALEYAALNAQIAEAEARKEEIKELVKAASGAAGVDKCVTDLWAFERVTSHTPRKLDPARLMEKGVKATVIEACYVGGTEYQYAQIRLRKPQN